MKFINSYGIIFYRNRGDTMKYVPLYIKTHNSLLSSMIKIEDLIIKAKEYNIDTLTITDDNMYGCMDFYMQCTKNVRSLM